MNVAGFSLGHPDTSTSRLGDLLKEELTVVQLVRYFGCLPCKAYIAELADRHEEIRSHGAGVVVIGGSADYQQQHLSKKGYPFLLMLDPEHQVRNAAGLSTLSIWEWLNPVGLLYYLKALFSGQPLSKITKDTDKSPGVLILDQSGNILWSQEGHYFGDYPSIDDVLAEIGRLRS